MTSKLHYAYAKINQILYISQTNSMKSFWHSFLQNLYSNLAHPALLLPLLHLTIFAFLIKLPTSYVALKFIFSQKANTTMIIKNGKNKNKNKKETMIYRQYQ